jgi:predicted transcriptional regulator
MISPEQLATFIATSFRSVWALEVLLLLKREARTLTTDELVASLRASTAVVNQALASLIAGGLVATEAGGVAYRPATADVTDLVEAAERSYATRPDQVRRTIIAAANPNLIAFSNAFRLKD